MKWLARRLALVVVVVCSAFGSAQAQTQCIELVSPGATVAQNFDGLSATAGSTTNVLTLPGWAMTEAGGGARDNEQYAVDTGASTTGDTYSYGSAGSGDRALGSLRSGTAAATFGACFTNNTGGQLTVLGVEYIAEQWRVGTIGRLDTVNFEFSLDASSLTTGAWTAVPALGFATPDSAARNGVGTAGSRDGNAAANRLSVSGNISGLNVAQGATLWLRWVDADASGADDGIAIDDLKVSAGGVSATPVLSISDTSVTEGNFSTTSALFTVSLSQPAGAGGVSFDFATADGTATAGVDYIAPTPASVTIAEGATSVTLGVSVNGDGDEEPDETFFLNVTNVVGATVGDAQGIGTISNDDVTLTPIHAIQGNGAMSPLVGTSVSTVGIVTGRKSNGFFIQTGNGEDDGNEATSEGIFVFTGAAPPAAAAVGNAVLVTATVAEYVPTADPYQLPMTELTAPTVLQLSTGHILPTAVVLTSAMPSAGGSLDQLERYEGMRVTADSFTVVAPTKGSTNETSATGTSNGIFNVVVTGVARPFREPGLQTPDPDPTGTTATAIPRWDFNPEMLTVDSDAIGGTQLNVPAGTVLNNLVGPLDYGFRRYTILAEAGRAVEVGPLPTPAAARLPTPDEFTVAGYNMERFFDTTNDPAISEPVLTPAAFETRLAKASLAIRNYLHSPDIVAVVEVENFSTLKTLADRINADAAAAPQPSFPGYVPYLVEGNDVGGIDVGFLVKTLQAGGVERVHVANVMQYGKSETWLDPSDNAQHLLNDRPPLLLYADVHFTDGRVFPVNVLVVHQRSLNGIDSEAADGLTTEGDRVRRKRQAQAEYLANLVQSLGSGSDHLVVLGDFNAFEFNDGYADAMGTVMGVPSADNETAVNGDGADLVDPDLINLVAFEDPDQHYSFVFDGNAQSLDHVLVNERLAVDAGAIDMDHARINADFPETARNDATSPARLADHDPAIAYIAVASADLSVELTAPATGEVGQAVAYHATVTNHGGYDARYPGVGFSLNAGVDDVVVTPPAGWSCDTPQVAADTTTVACSAALLAVGGSADFTLTATAPPESGYGMLTLVAATNARTQDLVATNDTATASVAVGAVSDLAIRIDAAASTSTDVAYRVRVSNSGPNETRAAFLLIDTNLPLGYEAFHGAAGWSCSTAGTGRLSLSCVLEEGSVANGAGVDMDIVVPRSLLKPSYYIHGMVDSATDQDGWNNEVRRRVGMPLR